jgi:hypothetical protein
MSSIPQFNCTLQVRYETSTVETEVFVNFAPAPGLGYYPHFPLLKPLPQGISAATTWCRLRRQTSSRSAEWEAPLV